MCVVLNLNVLQGDLAGFLRKAIVFSCDPNSFLWIFLFVLRKKFFFDRVLSTFEHVCAMLLMIFLKGFFMRIEVLALMLVFVFFWGGGLAMVYDCEHFPFLDSCFVWFLIIFELLLLPISLEL